MIKAEIFRNPAGLVEEVRISGHDGSRPHGESLICAAVSALTQTALLGVARHLKRGVDYQVESGYLSFKLQQKPDELTSAVLETMLLGLEEIRNIYPDEIMIKDSRR